MRHELTTAGPRGPGGTCYSPGLGQAICARVAAGESLRRIGAGAGWPTPQAVWKWAKAHPAFGEALAQAQKTARLASRLADRRREAARPGRRQAWRRGWPALYTPALGEEICARLAEGESLTAIARDPDMPALRNIYEWLQRRPEFEELYVLARQRQADALFDEALDVTRAATPTSVWADRLRFDALRWATARLAPRKYCEKLVVVEATRAEPEPTGMTVIVKRYADITPEEYARAAEGEP
jgi:hypothetical protein